MNLILLRKEVFIMDNNNLNENVAFEAQPAAEPVVIETAAPVEESGKIKTANTFATVSMILGIIGLVCCGATSTVALVFAIISKALGSKSGRATTGLVTAIIGMALAVIVGIVIGVIGGLAGSVGSFGGDIDMGF